MNPKVKVAIAFLEHSLQCEVHVGDVAQLVRLSPSRFCHLFTSEVGMSVTQYLKKARMEKARGHLETSFTFKPVKAIAAEVGYHDANYFEREFKKFDGMTPSQYRAANLTRIAAKKKVARKKQQDSPGCATNKFRKKKTVTIVTFALLFSERINIFCRNGRSHQARPGRTHWIGWIGSFD